MLMYFCSSWSLCILGTLLYFRMFILFIFDYLLFYSTTAQLYMFQFQGLYFFFVFLLYILIFHVCILLARPRGLRGEFPGNSLGECEPLDAFNTRAAANAAS